MLKFLVLVCLILLALSFFRGRNPIWGGATGGVILGAIVGIFKAPFLTTLAYGFVIGTLLGLLAETLGLAGDYLSRKRE